MRRITIIDIAALAGIVAVTGCGHGTSSSTVVGGGGVPPIGTRKPQIASPGAVTFDPTGKFAYVLQPAQKAIGEFTLNSDGSVTPLSPATISTGSYTDLDAIAHTASGSFLYATTASSAGNVVGQYQIGAGGSLTPMNPPTVTPQGQVCLAIIVDQTNHFVYTADAGGPGGVDQFKINADGTLTSIGFLSLGPVNQIAISADGKWMFTNGNLNNVHINVLKVNSDGTLSLSGSAGTSSYSLFAANPNLPALYALASAGGGASQLDAFTINGDGTLTPLGQPLSVPEADNLNPLAISPNGKAIYMPAPFGTGVAQIRINSNGSLSPMSPPTVTADGPTTALAITPDGTHLFASSTSVVDTYKINADGTLTPL